MSTNVSVIQKLEGLLSRVTRRAAEPRQGARHEAPTTVPPPMEAVSIAQPKPYVAPVEPELELVPVDESEQDVHLPVVEAVAAPTPAVQAAAQVEAHVEGAPQPSAPAAESIAVATPEPVIELRQADAVAPEDAVARLAAEVALLANDARTAPPPASPPRAVLEELSPISEPVPTPIPTGDPPPVAAAEAAPEPVAAVPVPAEPVPAEPVVAEPIAAEPAAAAPEVAAIEPETAPVVVATPPSIAAPPAHVIADADTADGSVPVMVDVPVVHERPVTLAPAAAASTPAAEREEAEPAVAATSLDGSRTEPPPPMAAHANADPDESTVVAVPLAPPVAIVEVPALGSTHETTEPADLAGAAEEAIPSSSRRVRTVPPGEGAALTHESGAHVIPERPAAPGELSLSVQGTVFARAPLPAGAEVAVFASSAAAAAPATFGALLDDSLSLGE